MTTSHFELLGLPERFALDAPTLEAAYLARSRDAHPDRFAAAPAAERVAAVQRAMALNDAYQVLRRPVRRAEYLLGRHGLAIGDHERLDDHRLLVEILELREELAEARAAGAAGRVSALERRMKGHHRALVEALGARFAEVDGGADGAGRAQALAAIKRTLIELRYVERYLEECAAALDDDEDA
jgi:molecular chaperone HscB